MVTHLGRGSQIKDSILAHFGNDYRAMQIYSFIIWLSFIPMLVGYFRIICLQIQGLMGHQSPWVAPCVAGGLVVVLLIVRNWHIGEEILALGVISIIVYILFLGWAQTTAPKGEKEVPAFGAPVTLAAALIQALEVHDFLVANILKNPNR